MKTSNFIVFGIAAVGAFACGGSSSSVSTNLQQATADAANAYCQRTQSCAPAYLTDAYGDVATCVREYQAILMSSLGANGTTETPAQVEACAQALPSTSCSDLVSRNPPSACMVIAGTLSNGTACGSDSQCAGGRCHLSWANADCGTCGEPTAAGGACTNADDCQYSMSCTAGVCVPYGAQNAACDTNHPCLLDLGCVGGTCGMPGTAGAKCATSAECDTLHGIFCHPLTLECVTISFAGPTAACGLINNQLVACSGPGANCAGVTAPMYQGTCSPYAPNGASCDTVNGAFCDGDSVCVTPNASTTTGVCAADDANECQ